MEPEPRPPPQAPAGDPLLAHNLTDIGLARVRSLTKRGSGGQGSAAVSALLRARSPTPNSQPTPTLS